MGKAGSLSVEPMDAHMGATIRNLDLSQPLTVAAVGQVISALGRYGILRFPDQVLDPAQQTAFARQFGQIKTSARYRAPGVPEVSFLSNILENGESIGYVDAGMIWHKDLTAHATPGYATALHAMKVPRRDGKPLGDTVFVNVEAAYADLPAEIKAQLKGAIGIHSSENYNKTVRAAGSGRPVYKQQGATFSHPLLITHPVTGREILYCDPGHVVRIEGLPDGVDEAALRQRLSDHQLQEKYQFAFHWTEGDVLMWDNLATLHRGTLDYRQDEHRLMKRSLILGDRIFDPAFVQTALAQH
jgi:taurine dioxygenase